METDVNRVAIQVGKYSVMGKNKHPGRQVHH